MSALVALAYIKDLPVNVVGKYLNSYLYSDDLAVKYNMQK